MGASSLALAGLFFAFAAPASAQSGIGSQLDDPTGRAPVRTHAPPFNDDGSLSRRPARTVSPDDSAERPGLRGSVTDLDATEVPSPPGYGAPPVTVSGGNGHLADRLRALDASWAVLGAQGTNYTNSVLSLIVGAAQVVLGGVFLEVGPPYDLIAPILMVTGGVQVARTIVVDFILRPNPQPIAIQYASMPNGTRPQRLARLRYGEAQLESLAEASATLRYVDSGINIAGAAALVGAYFGIRPNMDFDPIELIFFIGPAISLVIAVINLFTPSNAERRWDAYRQLRERTGGDRVEITPVLGVDPNGGGFGGLQGRF